jgi:fructose-specific phosphotransferase system IIC component
VSRAVIVGLVLGLLAAFPSLGAPVLALASAAGLWLVAQPFVWAFAAGAFLRPHIGRHFTRGAP